VGAWPPWPTAAAAAPPSVQGRLQGLQGGPTVHEFAEGCVGDAGMHSVEFSRCLPAHHRKGEECDSAAERLKGKEGTQRHFVIESAAGWRAAAFY